MRRVLPVPQPTQSPIKDVPEALTHELVGKQVTGVRRITKLQKLGNGKSAQIVETDKYGVFIQVDGHPYVCIDIDNSFIAAPDARTGKTIAASSFMGRTVEAALEFNGNTMLAVDRFTFARVGWKVNFELSNVARPVVEQSLELPEPSHDWVPIMQVVRQECGTCSQELAGGCCENECHVWELKVKAHAYHKDLHENPCDHCPKSPDKSSSGDGRGVGKCAKQIKLGYAVAEGGEIISYVDNDAAKKVDEVMARKTAQPQKTRTVWVNKAAQDKPWSKALAARRHA